MAIAPIPRDDAGLHRLQEANAARAAGTITPLAPTPRIEDRPAEPLAPTGPAVRQDRRRQDRRAAQRRHARDRVLLDTRASADRRRQERRGNQTHGGHSHARLDVYA